ncbi:hypothetical protein XENORESO_009417 [Xenotaenia resolanae]|uniref:Uncharacterized protein n=1 Tax=Xenotaenia resolanae TaxID=208358 RepID=A0ABV0W633_9TELE
MNVMILHLYYYMEFVQFKSVPQHDVATTLLDCRYSVSKYYFDSPKYILSWRSDSSISVSSDHKTFLLQAFGLPSGQLQTLKVLVVILSDSIDVKLASQWIGTLVFQEFPAHGRFQGCWVVSDCSDQFPFI